MKLSVGGAAGVPVSATGVRSSVRFGRISAGERAASLSSSHRKSPRVSNRSGRVDSGDFRKRTYGGSAGEPSGSARRLRRARKGTGGHR